MYEISQPVKAHRKWTSNQSMHGMNLGTLYIFNSYAVESLCGTPKCGARAVSDYIAWLWISFLWHRAALSSLSRRWTLSYWNLIWQSWLISIRSLPLYWREKGVEGRREVEGEKTERSRGGKPQPEYKVN